MTGWWSTRLSRSMVWRPVTRPRPPAAALALLALAVLAPGAAANVPAPVCRAKVLRDPARGGANGELTTRVTYTSSTATAVASTGDGIGLRQGLSFLLRTCLAYHLHGATPLASNGSALPAGVSSTHPAFADAPGYYEVGSPTGAYAGQAPRGVVLVIHAGAWLVSGPLGVQSMRPDAVRWRARGWETVSFTHRACGQSAMDAPWFHDRARAWFGAGARICALGTSSGGHLALPIGAYRPDLYCVVSQAGATDLRTVQGEVAYDAATGLYDQTNSGRQAHNLAAAAFGESLPACSPAAQASATLRGTRVLQALSADDATVPCQQAADLADAMRAANPDAYVDDVLLATGTIPFAHGFVTQAALDDFHAREERLVAANTVPAFSLGARPPAIGEAPRGDPQGAEGSR
jgi:hypothetical protein